MKSEFLEVSLCTKIGVREFKSKLFRRRLELGRGIVMSVVESQVFAVILVKAGPRSSDEATTQ
jgi:hypothetical protein